MIKIKLTKLAKKIADLYKGEVQNKLTLTSKAPIRGALCSSSEIRQIKNELRFVFDMEWSEQATRARLGQSQKKKKKTKCLHKKKDLNMIVNNMRYKVPSNSSPFCKM